MTQEIGIDRPKEKALSDAIWDAIHQIAIPDMTVVEVMGVLEMTKHELVKGYTTIHDEGYSERG